MKILNNLVVVTCLFAGLNIAAMATELELEGGLIPIYVDGNHDHNHEASLRYHFVSGDKTYRVKFENGQPAKPHKLGKIKIRAHGDEQELSIDSYQSLNSKARLVNSTPSFARGSKNVLVVPVRNISRSSSSFIYDPATLSSLYFSNSKASLQSYYQSVSSNQVSFRGEVANEIQVSNACRSSYNNLMTDALIDVLKTIGEQYDLSQFDIVSLVVPNDTSCLPYGTEGLGSLGRVNFADFGITGLPNIAFNIVRSNQVPAGNTNTFLATLTHEVGHNFGLKHDNGHVCGKRIFYAKCPSLAYGGAHSIMGFSANLASVNAIHQEDLGWLSGSRIIQLSGNKEEVYTIAAMEVNTSMPKAIKINRGDGVNYVIEYHKPAGIAASRAYPHSASYNGFKVYINDDSNINDSILLRSDMEDITRSLRDFSPSDNEYYDFEEAKQFAIVSDFTSKFEDGKHFVQVILESKTAETITVRVIVGEGATANAELEDIDGTLDLYPIHDNIQVEAYSKLSPRIITYKMPVSRFDSVLDRIEFDMDGDGTVDVITDSYDDREDYIYQEAGTYTRKAKIYFKSGKVISLESKPFKVVMPFTMAVKQPRTSISSEPVLSMTRATKLKLQFDFPSSFVASHKKKIKMVNHLPFKVRRTTAKLQRKVRFEVALPPENQISSHYLKDDGYYEFEFDLYLRNRYRVGSYRTIKIRVKSSQN